MFTDSQKNLLWIGSIDQGYTVCYNYKERFNTNNPPQMCLKDKSVKSVAVDKERNLWIATLSDGMYMYNMDSKEVKQIDMRQLFKQDYSEKTDVTHIFVDNDNNIWLGALLASKQLEVPLPERRVASRKHLRRFYADVFAQDSRGTLWVGTLSHLFYAMRQNEKTFTPVQTFLADGHVHPRHTAAEQRKIWVASS